MWYLNVVLGILIKCFISKLRRRLVADQLPKNTTRMEITEQTSETWVKKKKK